MVLEFSKKIWKKKIHNFLAAILQKKNRPTPVFWFYSKWKCFKMGMFLCFLKGYLFLIFFFPFFLSLLNEKSWWTDFTTLFLQTYILFQLLIFILLMFVKVLIFLQDGFTNLFFFVSCVSELQRGNLLRRSFLKWFEFHHSLLEQLIFVAGLN